MPDPVVEQLVRDIDRERARLKRLLRAQTDAALTTHPRPGDWSAVENVRHLLFAEQLHLGAFVPGGVRWSPLGLTTRTARQFADVGTSPTTDVATVFEAWEAVHRSIRAAVWRTDADVRHGLEVNLRHIGIHIRVIEQLLRTAASDGATAAASGKRARAR